jgi:hypothetical protein
MNVKFRKEMFRNNTYELRRKLKLLVTNKTYGNNKSLKLYQTETVFDNIQLS